MKMQTLERFQGVIVGADIRLFMEERRNRVYIGERKIIRNPDDLIQKGMGPTKSYSQINTRQ